ncbi:MAG: FAD-dependent oxidoreductase [Methanomassiliicoccus sp.]|nr:FAD-dependent oxidoreductase [Methanomassiliicoccus sp.]
MSREGAKSRARGKVLIIGGGIAGMSASLALSSLGHEVSLVERSPCLGGRASRLHLLFPDRRPSWPIVHQLVDRVEGDGGIGTFLSREVTSWEPREGKHAVELDDGQRIEADAVVLATGLECVPAALVPEFGHGLKKGVLTTMELEERLALGKDPADGELRAAVFVQCVGSRTERRGVPYCSALCCASSIKNALALKKGNPEAEVTVLYIDIRTAGVGQEALYREARRTGVRFIRGQPSLVMERDGRLVVCGENTLLRELYEIPADLVILATGVRQSASNLLMMDEVGIAQGVTGFPTADGSRTSVAGVFLAGSAKGPMDLPTAVQDAKGCALDVHAYLGRMAGQV